MKLQYCTGKKPLIVIYHVVKTYSILLVEILAGMWLSFWHIKMVVKANVAETNTPPKPNTLEFIVT